MNNNPLLPIMLPVLDKISMVILIMSRLIAHFTAIQRFHLTSSALLIQLTLSEISEIFVFIFICRQIIYYF